MKEAEKQNSGEFYSESSLVWKKLYYYGTLEEHLVHYLCMQPTTIMTVIIKGSFNSSWRLQYAVKQIRKKRQEIVSGIGKRKKKDMNFAFLFFF